jgi:hypothetical protein
VRGAASVRECDISSAVKGEEETATDHIAACAVGLDPVPGVTELIGELSAAIVGVVVNEVLDEGDLLGSRVEIVDDFLPSHGGENNIDFSGRQVLLSIFFEKPVNYYRFSHSPSTKCSGRVVAIRFLPRIRGYKA